MSFCLVFFFFFPGGWRGASPGSVHSSYIHGHAWLSDWGVSAGLRAGSAPGTLLPEDRSYSMHKLSKPSYTHRRVHSPLSPVQIVLTYLQASTPDPFPTSGASRDSIRSSSSWNPALSDDNPCAAHSVSPTRTHRAV